MCKVSSPFDVWNVLIISSRVSSRPAAGDIQAVDPGFLIEAVALWHGFLLW